MKQVSLSFFILQTIYGWISGPGFREWGVLVAELLVVWVIYLEVRHARDVSFLEKSTNSKANDDRRKIYNAFLPLPGNLDGKASAFCEMIQKPEKKDLKHTCERQIALFNDLGFSSRKPLWSWRGRTEDPLVTLLPHSTIYIWVILKPYILKRRADTGPWYSTPLMKFAVRSADFVLRHKRGLRFRAEGGGADIEITEGQLKTIRNELSQLLKN